MKIKLRSLFFTFIFGMCGLAQACIWDAKTLAEEQKEHPTLADAILHPQSPKPDIAGLTKHLQELQQNAKTNDPAWWNELA